jgi:hypothetical protein
MKRVYTDPRFPGIEVHNEGNRFRVYELSDGQQHEIDSFSTFSDHPNRLITDQVAEKRARDYFERMAQGRMSDELLDREEIADEQAPAAPARGGAAPDAPYGLSASKDLDSLMGDNIMTADDVLAAYDQAKGMADGPEKQQALERVRSMAQQMESSATELVRRLLG